MIEGYLILEPAKYGGLVLNVNKPHAFMVSPQSARAREFLE
jgi:hypothetical protein